jgi:hypothetical protein
MMMIKKLSAAIKKKKFIWIEKISILEINR